jgi:ATP-dependent Clp protease ATP-binding subunit ClpB
VGYDEGGQLTEAVRRKPYSVVLLDEIEKAHPDLFNILLQVLDDGRLTDNKGRVVNFKNTIIIMTSNIGSHIIQEYMNASKGNINAEDNDKLRNEILGLMRKTIRPEFLNRIDELIMFSPLSKDDVREITKMQIGQIIKKLQRNGVGLKVTEEAINIISERGFDPQYGARPLKRVIQRQILNRLSKEILANSIEKDKIIVIDRNNSGELVFRN